MPGPEGFVTIEAAHIFRLGEDAAGGKTTWTPDEARGLVEEKFVGVEFAGSPFPGGRAASLAFLLGACVSRDHPLKRGQPATTGAASCIQDIEAGQPARIAFGDLDAIRCVTQPARPADGQGGRTDGDHELGAG